jgi:hypothetical protein
MYITLFCTDGICPIYVESHFYNDTSYRGQSLAVNDPFIFLGQRLKITEYNVVICLIDVHRVDGKHRLSIAHREQLGIMLA